PEGGDSEGEISGFQVSGVRCQGRKTRKLKPETSVFVIWNFYSFNTPTLHYSMRYFLRLGSQIFFHNR
ncbi:MAG: hypothetical protein WBH05_15355, partial [Syntrophobacteria bacterium]